MGYNKFFGFFVLFFAFEIHAVCELDFEDVQDQPIILTMETAISRALNCNRQLMNAYDAQLQSEYHMALALNEFDIKFTPKAETGYIGGGRAGSGISVGGGFDLSKKLPCGTKINLNPNIIQAHKHFETNIRAMITQPLLRGFNREYQMSGVKNAQYALRSATRSLYISQLHLVMRTIHALYDVIKAQKALEIHQESYNRLEKFFQAAKVKEKMELADSLDVYRAEIELRHAEDNMLNSQERLQEFSDILRDMLVLPLESIINVEVPLDYAEHEIDLDEAIELALTYRIEIQQAADQQLENERLMRNAKEELCPDVNLVLNYSSNGSDQVFTDSWRHRESTWGVGFTTSSDFNMTSRRIAYEQSLIAIGAAARGVEQAKANVILEVKRTIRCLQRAYKHIHLQEQQIKTALGELYRSQIKFERGMSNNFDVIQAEKTLHTAQISYWNAIIDAIVGEYQLLEAIGILTDKR